MDNVKVSSPERHARSAMVRDTRQPPTPRKTPTQSRSVYTVRALIDACTQVLLQHGLDRLTTTRVAAQAGVSVGALYQYFPHKTGLLQAALEHHLSQQVDAIEAACKASQGGTVDTVVRALVEAHVDSQLRQADAVRALAGLAAEPEGQAVLERQSRRLQRAVARALGRLDDLAVHDARLQAFMLVTALAGPTQALLRRPQAPGPAERARFKQQLCSLAAAYLRDNGTPRGSAAPPAA